MRIGPAGTTVTTAADPRITRFGAFLRRTKLDELPQLINVLRGEMSLVGPRPDVADFVALDGPQARVILSVPPGITGPATLVFRNEEELLARQADPERFNVDVLVPAKARINEHYVRTWTLRHDLRYLLLTLRGASLSEAEAMA
jgi:lipopolysaccharide/colanic/teichoic acid biosynthesis glycosyltransferase